MGHMDITGDQLICIACYTTNETHKTHTGLAKQLRYDMKGAFDGG